MSNEFLESLGIEINETTLQKQKDKLEYSKRHYSKNKEKIRQRQHEWYINNKEKQYERQKKIRKDNPDVAKHQHYLSRYGKTLDQIKLVLIEQNYQCFICKKSKKLDADHCHKSKKFRSFLCRRCNLNLVPVENIEILISSIKYLEKFGFDKNELIRRLIHDK